MAKTFARQVQQASFLLSLGGVLLLFSVIASITYLWYPGGLKIFPSGSYGGALAFVCVCAGIFIAARSSFSALTFDPQAAACALLLVFFSDWLCRGYGFMQGPSIRGEILLCTIVSYIALSRSSLQRYWGALLGIVIVGCLYCYLSESAGRLLFSDDHGTFQYRLMLLKDNFPFIPFYNPQWNAGLDARDSFATGVLNLFFLSLPLVYLFAVESWYTVFIGLLIFVFFPLTTALAARVAGHHRTVGWIAAILILCSGLHWYRWTLKYGTMGFVISALLLPLILATAARVISSEEVKTRQSLYFIASMFLALCWPFFGVVLLPLCGLLVAVFLYSWRRDSRQELRFRRLFLIGMAVVALQTPLLITFIGTSNISTFLVYKDSSSEALKKANLVPAEDPHTVERRFRHRSGSVNLQSTFSALRTIFFSSNPVLLFFGLGGLFFLSGWFRILSILHILWFFLLGGVLYPLKPQLELDRLLVLILLVLAIPAAEALYRFIRRVESERKVYRTILCAFSLGFVFTGPMVVWGIARNRSVEQYYFAGAMVNDFKKFLSDYQPTGRILFSGCILHEYGGGHLAPLAYETGIPMVASSQAHTLWWYKDVIPPVFMVRGDVGKEEYFDLYNISDIFAHEPKWKKYFKQQPDKYELLWSGHGFDFFRRRDFKSSYVLEGSADILEQRSDGVLLRVQSKNALLKFRYNRALEAPGCVVKPRSMYGNISFVELKDCTPGATIYLREKVPWRQLFLSGRKSIQ